jgi:hypothetical protein
MSTITKFVCPLNVAGHKTSCSTVNHSAGSLGRGFFPTASKQRRWPSYCRVTKAIQTFALLQRDVNLCCASRRSLGLLVKAFQLLLRETCQPYKALLPSQSNCEPTLMRCLSLASTAGSEGTRACFLDGPRANLQDRNSQLRLLPLPLRFSCDSTSTLCHL